jgi:sensor histidine kinase YesM
MLPATKKENHREGIGIVNVKKRLSLLYHGKHKLEIGKMPDSFHVSMDIDLDENQKGVD